MIYEWKIKIIKNKRYKIEITHINNLKFFNIFYIIKINYHRLIKSTEEPYFYPESRDFLSSSSTINIFVSSDFKNQSAINLAYDIIKRVRNPKLAMKTASDTAEIYQKLKYELYMALRLSHY